VQKHKEDRIKQYRKVKQDLGILKEEVQFMTRDMPEEKKYPKISDNFYYSRIPVKQKKLNLTH